MTKNVIKEARIEDVKKELLKSERLESHFAAHPKDLTVLQHTEPLTQHQNRPHLSKPLPGYIVLPEVPKLQPRKVRGYMKTVKHLLTISKNLTANV